MRPSHTPGAGSKEEFAVAIEAEAGHGKLPARKRSFAHLRATPEETARILAAAAPFDVTLWQKDAKPPTTEELVDLEEFLQEREEMRLSSLERARERLVEPGK
jgi:hypothetical protein